MEKIINIGGRLHNPAVGGALTGANEIKDDTKGKMQNVINQETDAELLRLDGAKQDKMTFDQTPTENSTNPVTSGGVYAADAALQQVIEAILLLIPSAASALNQLADKSFVNSSIATATATFRGTYNLVTDLELTVSATHQQIATALASVVSTADNNDYCFVQIPVSDQSSEIRVTERYKFDGTSWSYEYDLNNSGFTADQWAAINSGITSVLVGKLGALPTAAELAIMFNGKQNTLTFDTTPTSDSNNPVTSGGLYAKFATIDAMIPTGADANNKLVAENRLVAYVTTLINALDATFDVTSADGHVTLRMTQADGVITSVQILTSDIASDAALTLLGGRVSTAESDIDALQDAYAALTQSDVVIVEGALPSSGQQQNIIYRQPDQEHTPPQYYSDYMWNGTTWVLMAMYMNGIDPRPKKGSQNLVTSGGVFDNMGALDVSELNATENPHTLATYVDLSAALAAIPSDYQKGGMSIKFVQTSDNKYVQYRLMNNTWSIDTAYWALYSEDVLIDNPEWVQVVTDKQDKILYGVKTDGKFYFGDGCPPQVIEYVNNYIGEYGYNKSTINLLLNTKVDKEPGKSLIDAEFATSQKVIQNPEYLQAITDFEGKLLEGVTVEGKKKLMIPQNLMGVETSVVDNPEWIDVLLDRDGKIIYGINKQGELVAKLNSRTIKNIKEYLELTSRIKVSIIGDSISTFKGYIPYDYGYTYPLEDVQNVNDTWWKSVINEIGGQIEVNVSNTGSTSSNLNTGFRNRTLMLGNPDMIFVELGTNDWGNGVPIGSINFDEQNPDLSKFAPSYIDGIKRLKDLYPHADIVCFSFKMSDIYADTIKTIAEHYNCKYIDVRSEIEETLHPNKTQMTLAAGKSLLYISKGLSYLYNN